MLVGLALLMTVASIGVLVLPLISRPRTRPKQRMAVPAHRAPPEPGGRSTAVAPLMNARARLGPGVMRAIAAVFCAPLLAFVSGAACIAIVPVSEPLAFAIGFHLVIPLWAVLACLLPLVSVGRST